MNSCSLVVYLERKYQQQNSRRFTYVSNQDKHNFSNLVTSILFSSLSFPFANCSSTATFEVDCTAFCFFVPKIDQF